MVYYEENRQPARQALCLKIIDSPESQATLSMVRSLSLALLLLIGLPLQANPQKDIEAGVYATDRFASRIEIYKCGIAFCGKLVSFAPQQYHRIKELTPAELRKAGMKILWGVRPHPDGSWQGQVYSPQDGRIYHCTLKPGQGSLKVRHSIDAWGLIGKTSTWIKL